MKKLPLIKCFFIERDTTTDPPNNLIDIIPCEKVEPVHPCDPPLPCDPFEIPLGICPKPFLCLERIKNPAYFGEITRCKPGDFIPTKSCVRRVALHPCDPLPACSTWTEEQKLKKPPCIDPALCKDRIKNYEHKKKPLECDPTK